MQSLLDLGCGTGLELEPIFARFPDLQVTGIDLSQAMLNKLREKFPDKPIELICASYLDYDFGLERYDAAASFESLHHLEHAQKLALYQAIFRSIQPGGSYLEADYMVDTQEEEDHWFAESRRLRAEQGIGMDELYHYDTPLTISNQKRLLEQAGFYNVDEIWRVGATSILVARKP
ncbi:MAG: class I SAM-dependent methyltransferase [Coriobacteriia bacterium]|nr:class I SAM-dependent methyltransferase [Coriobacteriia bacterium]